MNVIFRFPMQWIKFLIASVNKNVDEKFDVTFQASLSVISLCYSQTQVGDL